MRAMKDSGIEWIGEIPEEWDVKPTFVAFKERRYKNVGNIETNLLSLSYGKIIRKDASNNMGLLPESFENYNIIEKDNIVFRLTDLQNDHVSLRSAIVPERGIITSAYVTIESSMALSACYFNYLFRSYDYCKVFYNMGGGVRQGINYDELKRLPLAIPTFSDQKAIADYLDRKCSLIDSTIEKQKAVIEKLKLYKQSIITEAVTKGLDPNAKMKLSGIEWIGEIPEHWNLRALKFILKERNQKNIPILTKERLSLSIGKGVTLYADKTTNKDRFKDDVTQYKVAHPNDLVINSMNVIVGAVGISNYLGCVSPAYYVMYSDKPEAFSIKYFDYAFKTSTIRKVLFCLGKGIMAIERGNDRVNTCRLKVSSYDLGRLKFPVPPITEQQKIVEYLEVKSSAIDSFITTKQIVIDKLAEYKKSLIYEYVTGKREVI